MVAKKKRGEKTINNSMAKWRNGYFDIFKLGMLWIIDLDEWFALDLHRKPYHLPPVFRSQYFQANYSQNSAIYFAWNRMQRRILLFLYFWRFLSTDRRTMKAHTHTHTATNAPTYSESKNTLTRRPIFILCISLFASHSTNRWVIHRSERNSPVRLPQDSKMQQIYKKALT